MISLNWHCQELFIVIKIKKKHNTVFVMKTLLKLQSAYSPGGIFMLLLNEHTLCFVIIMPRMRAGLVAWLSPQRQKSHLSKSVLFSKPLERALKLH